VPRLKPIPSGHSYDLILALTLGDEDSAALALRTTRGMAAARRGVLAAPQWTYCGPITSNAVAQDELSAEIAKSCAPGAKVLLVTEGVSKDQHSAGNLLRYGKLQGCLEGLLAALNCFDGPSDTLTVRPTSWQASELATHAKDSDHYSETWNQLAQLTVFHNYRLKVSGPLARAVLLADHTLLKRRCWR
jgi:hypothetical protein